MAVEHRSFAAAIPLVLLMLAGTAKAACDLIPVKNQNFGGLELIRACSILPFRALQPQGPDICQGLPVTPPQEPLVNVVARDMLYFNWEIPSANVPRLEAALQLADRGFRIAPIEIVRGEAPRPYLSLNFYATTIAGVLTYRTEWSTYVKDRNDVGSERQYLMVVDVDSSAPSLNPVDLFTPPAVMDYRVQDGRLVADIKRTAGAGAVSDKFYMDFGLPAPDAPVVRLHEPWVLANDRIYWRNGVYDLVSYNGSLLAADVVEVDPKSLVIRDHTAWARFVDATPTQVLVFRKPLQFVLHPWFNAGELCSASGRGR